MGDRIETFEQLEAWKPAREVARFVYAAFRRATASQDFGLRDQAQTAAVSAMTNIAEGFERVRSANKLLLQNIARASCGEVRSLSYVMFDADYVSAEEQQELLSLAARTGRLAPGLLCSTRARTA